MALALSSCTLTEGFSSLMPSSEPAEETVPAPVAYTDLVKVLPDGSFETTATEFSTGRLLRLRSDTPCYDPQSLRKWFAKDFEDADKILPLIKQNPVTQSYEDGRIICDLWHGKRGDRDQVTFVTATVARDSTNDRSFTRFAFVAEGMNLGFREHDQESLMREFLNAPNLYLSSIMRFTDKAEDNANLTLTSLFMQPDFELNFFNLPVNSKVSVEALFLTKDSHDFARYFFIDKEHKRLTASLLADGKTFLYGNIPLSGKGRFTAFDVYDDGSIMRLEHSYEKGVLTGRNIIARSDDAIYCSRRADRSTGTCALHTPQDTEHRSIRIKRGVPVTFTEHGAEIGDAENGDFEIEIITDGRSQGYIHGTMKNGKFEGIANEYDSSGTYLATSTWKNGLLHGDREVYYPNGNLSVSEIYRNGLLEGESVYFDESGNITTKMNFRKGKLEGEYVKYENGLVKERSYYSNDVREGKSVLYEHGDLWATIQYRNGAAVSGICADGRSFTEAEIFNWNRGAPVTCNF